MKINGYEEFFDIDCYLFEDNQFICPFCHVNIPDFKIYRQQLDIRFEVNCWFCSKHYITGSISILPDENNDYYKQVLFLYNNNQDKVIVEE